MNDLLGVLWEVIIWVVLICTTIATFRLLLNRSDLFSNYSIINFISSEKWLLSLFIIIFSTIIEFGTNRLSPLPWKAFSNTAARHGVLEGVFVFLEVGLADIWLLWVPAHIYARDLILKIYNYELNQLEPEKVRSLIHRQGILIRIINVLVGLLLMTPNNLMITLIKLLP